MTQLARTLIFEATHLIGSSLVGAFNAGSRCAAKFERAMPKERPQKLKRVVMITGAGGGLGSALARVHAELGHNLVLLDLSAEALKKTAAMAEERGAEALRVECDVRAQEQCQRAVDAALERFGHLDTLYNNAAIPLRGEFSAGGADQLKRVMEVNLIGAARMTQAALPAISAQRGRVAAISSVAGFSPLAGRTAYVASKHALHGFFGSLRLEVARSGVSVTLACPSYIKTSFRAGSEDKRAELHPDFAARTIAAGVEARERVVLVGRRAKFAWIASRLAPRAFERLTRRDVIAQA